jgi:hypothetical protein
MTREGTTRDSFTGRAGQLAVLAELLMRRVNAAIPEVDEGEDTLAFVSGAALIDHIQVKTAVATALKTEDCYAAKVSVPLTQMKERDEPPLYYVFAVRLADAWSDFVILSRKQLERQREEGVGYVNTKAGELQLYLSFSPTTLTVSQRDWSPFRGAWQSLPVLQRRSSAQTE